MNNWPDTLTLNAHTGSGKAVSTAVISQAALAWAMGAGNIPKTFAPHLAPPPLADVKNWKDKDVGWGLVLPHRPELSPAQLATADDAPEPIRRLRAERNDAPVFRYRSEWTLRYTHLTTYRTGVEEIVPMHSALPGLAAGRLPFYLLIYGSPETIPWGLQFNLNASRAVGRLDLDGEALENYVAALINEWSTAESDAHDALFWSANNGQADITKLMRDSIADRIQNEFKNYTDMKQVKFIDGFDGGATSGMLVDALEELKPGFILTTSHGQTGPLDDAATMARDLGLLVDENYDFMRPEQILADWQPDGAIWYAHACCSAGSNSMTMYDGLVPPGSDVDLLLKGVATVGSLVAPLPRALLGAKKPLRAFVGQVEPTFDWTLQQPHANGYLTGPLQLALFNHLFQPEPLGMALRSCYEKLGSLYTAYDQAFRDFNSGADTRSTLLFCQLAARDVQSMVILGDPTAILRT
ncbi:MAG TPA: hypothetical protein VFZ22_07685 [Pyrinomonadaceae bacterium]|nr:hypothetical protein [Pyrinomonadaceae bacterium]